MKTELTAKTKRGDEIKFNAWVKNTFVLADFTLKTIDGKTAITLFPKKFEKMFGIKCPAKYVYVFLTKDSQSILNDMKREAEANEIKKLSWEEILNNNAMLHLSLKTTSGGKVILDLPDEFESYTPALIKKINWKSASEKYEDRWNSDAEMTAQELLKIIEEIDAETIEKKNRKKIAEEEIRTKAARTGKAQKIHEYPIKCDNSVAGCDWDTIEVLINPAGTKIEVRHHSY